MESVGIRELKARASEIVEAVHTSGKRYQVTRRGKPVARIVPTPDAIAAVDPEEVERDAAVWAERDALAEEIGWRWPTAWARSRHCRRAAGRTARLWLVRLVPMDAVLAGSTYRLAATQRLRGADAVYATLAQRLGLRLISWDKEQIARAGAVTP